jgi:hypothetical protein
MTGLGRSGAASLQRIALVASYARQDVPPA